LFETFLETKFYRLTDDIHKELTVMRLFWKLHIIICIIILSSVRLNAQDEKYVQEPVVFFPDFTVEYFHEIQTADDVVLPFIYNGYLYAFSLGQQLPLWRIFIGGDLTNPFIVNNGTLYLYDIYNRVYSIEITRGNVLWKVEIQSVIKGKPCIYNNLIIITTQEGTFYIINTDKGKIVYEYNGDGEINTGLNIYENLIIAPYKNGKIFAYDIDTKSVKWEFFSGGIISVSPVIKDGYMFFGAWDETFYALDVSTGTPLWVSYVGENISRDFIVFDNEIILFFSKGEILCLSRNDGEIKWVKYFGEIEFNYNYFAGINKFFIFIPDLIAVNTEDGASVFNYRERAFYFYKEMLFENMIEGERQLSDEDKIRLLTEKYFTVSNYPLLPPIITGELLIYFVADNSYFYVYNLKEDVFIVKYKLS